MPHWALKHLNNQVAGQGPGGPGQPNEAFAMNKSSNALCQGIVGWQDHAANCSTGQGAGRRNQEAEGALLRDQGTPSEPELMGFWAITCRGSDLSQSNWDLFWLGQQQGLCFYQKTFKGSETEQNYTLAMFFKVRVSGERLPQQWLCYWFGACEQF